MGREGEHSSLKARTRNPSKLLSGVFRTDLKKVAFSQCIMILWNSLPQDMAMASSTEGFERELYNFMELRSISGY